MYLQTKCTWAIVSTAKTIIVDDNPAGVLNLNGVSINILFFWGINKSKSTSNSKSKSKSKAKAKAKAVALALALELEL